jgi:hypothetical protein
MHGTPLSAGAEWYQNSVSVNGFFTAVHAFTFAIAIYDSDIDAARA